MSKVLEGSLCKAMKVKPKLQWRCHEHGAIERLVRSLGTHTMHAVMELRFHSCFSVGFSLALVPSLLPTLKLLPSGMKHFLCAIV